MKKFYTQIKDTVCQSEEIDKKMRLHRVISFVTSPTKILHQSTVRINQWFPSISDNVPKAISKEVCEATSENFFKKPLTPAFMHIKQ